MEKYESVPMEMPNEFMEAFSGFTLDIGCSTAKLLYRSKEDYTNGKAIKDELKGRLGRIFLIPSISRTELDDVIELVRTKCDILRRSDGTPPEIYSTGAGCNLFRQRLEKELGVRMSNAAEFECFANAFVHVARHVEYDRIFLPMDDATAAEVKKEEEIMAGSIDGFASWGLDMSKRATAEDIAAEEAAPKTVLPCIIAMCGSGIGYMLINEDGKFNLCGNAIFGGRAFLGLASLLSDERDFHKILEAIERGSCVGVDEFASDLVSADEGGEDTQDKEGDSYQHLNKFERSMFPFGKAATRSRDNFTGLGDHILHSLYKSFLINLVDGAKAQCNMNGIKNLYFCGNFVGNPTARNFIESRNAVSNFITQKDRRINLKFIKNGGHLGALGAFLKHRDEKD